MEKPTKAVVICPECGKCITEEDRNQGNVKEIEGKEFHKRCELIRK